MSQVLAFLGSVPALISLVKEIMAFLNKVSGNDPQGVILKLGTAFSQLNAAKSEEDYKNAAKALADAIHGG